MNQVDLWKEHRRRHESTRTEDMWKTCLRDETEPLNKSDTQT